MTATGFTVDFTRDPATFLAAAEPHLALDPVLTTVVSSVTHRAIEDDGRGKPTPEHPRWDETLEHWTRHYGGSPLEWGPDIRFYDYQPHWMVGYAWKRDELMRKRALAP